MRARQQCVECKQWIITGDFKCSCGWQIPHAKMNVAVDHDCQYQNKGRRCKLPGSMSTSTHAGGNWYCSYHYHSLGDPKQGEEMLAYTDNNHHIIMNERVDWRRKLYEDDFKIKKVNTKKETVR